MSDFIERSCPNCGGELKQSDTGSWSCKYCRCEFEDYSIRRKIQTMQEFLDQTKMDFVNNQRRNLYDAVCAKYISENDVRQYATEIKKYLPDDFQANFYLDVLSDDVKAVAKRIRDIDAKEHYDLLLPIVRFLIASVEAEYLLELNDLIERAYKKRDPALYSRLATELSVEAEKVSEGVYATFEPRDVFIAYSSKDMGKVSELCGILERNGFSCFVAARNLRHGIGAVQNYDKALREAMDNCTCFLFVSSTNSRSYSCDAVRKEIPYIREKDIANAPAELRHHYNNIPEKYKKPRIEYRLDTDRDKDGTSALTDAFFDGYEWVYTPEGVVERLVQILNEIPQDPASHRAVCNHVEVIDPAVEPTCTQAGRTEGSHCSLCGEILRQPVSVPAKGHSFGQWKATRPATGVKDGVKERSCVVCGAKETQKIPAFGGQSSGGKKSYGNAASESQGLAYQMHRIKKTCTVKGIGSCTDQTLVIPHTVNGCEVTEIEAGAFLDCKQLKRVVIPNSVTSIGKGAFRNCKYMTEVTVGAAVESIEKGTFEGCSGLKRIVMGASVEKIGKRAFKGCRSLLDMVIGDSVTAIGGYAFENCLALTTVKFGDSLVSIGRGAFSGCMNLTFADFKNSPIKCIRAYTFRDCGTLWGVALPDSVRRIGNYAFRGCKHLLGIEFTGTVNQWRSVSRTGYWSTFSGIEYVQCADGKIRRGCLWLL